MRRRVRIAPVLTRKLAPMPLQFANPVWVEEDQLEWAYHVAHPPRAAGHAGAAGATGRRLHLNC